MDAIKSGLDGLAQRFVAVMVLPVASVVLFLLTLVLGGAPGNLSLPRAWQAITHATTGDVFAVAGGIVLIALLLQPLQVVSVRLQEGYWPQWLMPLMWVGRAVQQCRRERWLRLEEVPVELPAAGTESLLQSAGQAGEQRRLRFPERELLMPTALGNALAAAEDGAGAPYGWDAVVAWPRLYPLLPNPSRALIRDVRNRMDTMVSFAVAGAVGVVGSCVLLVRSGWWLLLALFPLVMGWLAYRGAVATAMAYGRMLRVCFDLHRFSLIQASHLPLPSDLETERELANHLCLSWRQGVDVPIPYVHDVKTRDE